VPSLIVSTPAAILARLPQDLRTNLARAVTVGAQRGARLWLVGGVVRDLMIGWPISRDIDLAVEGDVTPFVSALAYALGGHIRATHAAFGTATVAIPGHTFDIARTRSERYPHPAVLPEVEPAPIETDLIRRDFSINAIAVELRAEGLELHAGALLDRFDGRADLAADRLRLLHPASLRDDPTRILRGLRLAARLGLTLDTDARAQIADALTQGYLGLLSSERVLSELCLALDEPHPAATLRLSDDWGVTEQLLPGLRWTPTLAQRLERAATHPDLQQFLPSDAGPWLRAGLFLVDQPDPAAPLARHTLPTPLSRLLQEVPSLRAAVPALTGALSPGALDALLHPFSTLGLAVLHYAEPSAAPAIAQYLYVLRPQRPPLNGRDLQRLGVPPGPQIGRLLSELRRVYLDGIVTDREAAERWVRNAAR
jgi:tRNA nucleotidyltransferase (CCA-adding enzyme)